MQPYSFPVVHTPFRLFVVTEGQALLHAEHWWGNVITAGDVWLCHGVTHNGEGFALVYEWCLEDQLNVTAL